MEGKTTYKYRFLRSLLENKITSFRAKHVLAWLKQVNYGNPVYAASAYTNIINPLLHMGYLRKDDRGSYSLTDKAYSNLENLRHKKTGPKYKQSIDEIEQIMNLPNVREIFVSIPEDPQEAKERNEWDNYVAKKLKGSL